MTAGIAVAGLCPACEQRVRRRASRIARWVALGTTLPLAVYVTVTLPRLPAARVVGAAGVVLWYVLTFVIAKRVATEWLR
jgi:hypothetical protein